MDGFLSLVSFWDNSFHSPVFIEEVDGIHHYRVDRGDRAPIFLAFGPSGAWVGFISDDLIDFVYSDSEIGYVEGGDFFDDVGGGFRAVTFMK